MQEQQQIQSLWRKCKIPVNKRGQEEWQMFYHKARLMHFLKSMSADAPAQETKTRSVQPLSPEEKNYIKYDFFSPRKFTKKNEDPQERI